MTTGRFFDAMSLFQFNKALFLPFGVKITAGFVRHRRNVLQYPSLAQWRYYFSRQQLKEILHDNG